jgi:putative membrane protein
MPSAIPLVFACARLSRMNVTLLVIGSAAIFLAALFHFYIFVLESVTWRTPKTWKSFGLRSQEHAEIIRPMAFNQGFYNLFLALGVLVGIALLGVNATVGVTLMLFAALCMVGAGVVLFISRPGSRAAALLQGMTPLIGVLLLVLALVTH